MNHLQKTWLKVLNPVINFMNEKIARRSGLIGRFGKFYAFGPRQFGYHPTNKALAFFNSIMMQNIPLLTHKYSLFKNLSQNGHVGMRPWSLPSLLGLFIVFGTAVYLIFPANFHIEEGTTLQVFTNSNIPAPYSALNDRVSAHYTEINSLYSWQMRKRLEQKIKQIERARLGQSDQTRKTRYAVKSYQYVQPHIKTL